MNPNLNNHMGIPHHHQGSQVQSSAPSLHSLHHTQLHPPHAHSHSHPSQVHLPPHYNLQQSSAPEHLVTLGDSLDHHRVQQQTNVDHYKSSAQPAFHGYIETTHDALIIFNACQLGECAKVTRRLHERERRLINSGAVYVFDEAEAGIKRWTDGRLWSPSRILNNFLVYREIDQKRPTATTNAAPDDNVSCTRANPNNKNPSKNVNAMLLPNSLTLSDHPSSSTGSHHPSIPSRPVTPSRQSIKSQNHQSPPQTEGSHPHDVSSLDSKPNISQDSQDLPQSQSRSTSENQSQAVSSRRPMNRERERALVGSLTSTYKFRPDGLVKKTISIAGMHMISYYKMEDVLVGRLRTPKTHDELRQFPINPRFLTSAFFRVPPLWGFTDGGVLWVRDEGPEESSQISGSNTPSPFQNGQRPGPQPLPKTEPNVSHSIQGVRGSLLQHHSNAANRLLPPALERPSSSSSSTGSPSATSPVSPETLPLLAAPNMNAQAGPISRVAVSANSSTRYEPYSRPPRSPSLAVSSAVANNNTLTDQQSTGPYYAQNQSTAGVNRYSTNPFLPDSHSTPLVAERNTRPDPTSHNGRTLNLVAEVSYGNSGSYRTHTTTSGGGESIYAQYTSTDTNNNSNRSASVPPSPYGLPSITRLRVAGQPGSSSSCNPDARGMGEYQFSASSNQQQVGRLFSPNLSHGGSYGTYLSPVPTEFRCHPGVPNLSGRQNNRYHSSPQSPGTGNNPPGETSSVSGTQSPTFLCPSPPTSTTTGGSFSCNYQFSPTMINQQPQAGNTSRRGSGVATLGSEMSHGNTDLNGGGSRISSLDRIFGKAPQRNQSENTASSWGQISSSHTMKTEEG